MFKPARGGFTLIEFVIVIGILSLSIGSILLLLTSVIKGTNQTNINAEVKQNGQAAFDAIERQIRGAESVNQMFPGALYGAESGIEIVQGSSNLYVICKPQTYVAYNSSENKNGWIGIYSGVSAPDSLDLYQKLTNTDLTNGVNIICAATGTKALQVNSVTSDEQKGIAVTIYFIAQQAINAPGRADFTGEAQFKTTISLRDYN